MSSNPYKQNDEKAVDSFVTSFMDVLSRASQQDVGELIAKLKDSWRTEAIRLFQSSPMQLEEKIGAGDEALDLIARAMKLMKLPQESASVVEWMKEARQNFDAKKYKAAFQCFQKAIVTETPTVDDLCVASTSAFHVGNLDYAEEYSGQALLIDPFEVRALVLRGLVSLKKEELETAKEYFERARRLEPSSNTVIRYIELADEKILESKKKSSAVSKLSGGSQIGAFKRKWTRKRVSLDIVVIDHESMASYTYQVRSLSAGGALIEGGVIPDEFSFSIDLNSKTRIHGTAEKIYSASDDKAGIVFKAIDPAQQDLINSHLIH